MEAFHSNYGGTGHFTVGVEIPANSEDLKINSVSEV